MKNKKITTEDTVQTYGSSITMKEVSAVCEEPIRVPQINKNYVQAIAVSKGSVGEADVREYHSRLFLEQNAPLKESCTRLISAVARNLAGLERHIQEVSEIIDVTKRYRDSLGEGVPWTTFARIQVAALALFSVLMILIGLNTVAIVLMNSGNPVWNTWWRCYLFSAVPVGLAFGVKIYKGWITDPATALSYCRLITVLGLVLGIIWTAMFGSTFPGLTQSVGDIIADISTQTAPKSSRFGEAAYIVVSFLAETTIAASCWLAIENLMHTHQPNTRQPNEARTSVQNDLNQLVAVKNEQVGISGQLQGKIDSMEHARKRFVEEAAGLYGDIAKHFNS